MANDVKVRLTAEGVSEVVAAFRKVEAEAAKAQKGTGKLLAGLKGQVGQLAALLPKIGAAAAVGGLAMFAKKGLDAADAAGKLAQKVGASTESLSALELAASTADVSSEQLEKGLTLLARNMTELAEGTDKQVEAFGKLGLAAKDLQGLDTAQALGLISERMAKIPDQSQKTAVAMEILGKSGAQLIPLMNDLGREGFDKLTERARELGLVIDTETAAAAQAANDSFTIIGQQAKGLAIQFASGFAPVIASTMQAFTEDTKGKGVASMREFGQKAARVIVTIINTFRLLGNVVGGVMGGIGRQLGGFAAAANALFSGNFREAARIWKLAGEDGRKDFAAFKAQFGKDIDRLVADATREPAKFELKPVANAEDIRDVETAKERADAERAARELKTAEENARKKAEAEAKEQERLADERGGFEQKLLELQGRRHEAALLALDEELAKYDEILKKQGVGDAERAAILEQYKAASLAQLTAQQKLAEGQLALDALARDRQAIENEVALGLKTQEEGTIAITALEQQRLVILQQIAAAALAAAEATKDPEAIASAQAMVQSVQDLQVELKKTPEGFKDISNAAADAAGAGLNELFNGAIEGSLTFRSVATSAIDAVRSALQQLIIEAIKAQIIKSIMSSFGGFSGGGAVKAASGGYISGPGTATSDSIPAYLSDGEFVVRAAVVQQPGVLEALTQLNRSRPGVRTPYPRFAGGGLAQAATQPMAQQPQEKPVRIVNVLDPDLVNEALSSSSGEQTIMNVMQRNKAGIKRILR